MTSRVTAHPAGGSEVRVEAEVDVAGKIVQFGRGMIEAVSKQLFKEFVTCVRATLEAAAVSGAAGQSALRSGPSTGGPQAAPPTRADNTRVAPPTSATTAKPVAVVPLVLRAIWATLSGWVARLFGRRRPA
jgi:uncharacterized protein